MERAGPSNKQEQARKRLQTNGANGTNGTDGTDGTDGSRRTGERWVQGTVAKEGSRRRRRKQGDGTEAWGDLGGGAEDLGEEVDATRSTWDLAEVADLVEGGWAGGRDEEGIGAGDERERQDLLVVLVVGRRGGRGVRGAVIDGRRRMTRRSCRLVVSVDRIAREEPTAHGDEGM